MAETLAWLRQGQQYLLSDHLWATEETNTGDLVGLTSTEGALNTNADIFSTFIGNAAATGLLLPL